MSDQRIRHGGCFPIEDFIDGFGDLHRSTVIFTIAIAQESVLLKDSTGINIMQVANIHADGAKVYDQTRNDQHLQFRPFWRSPNRERLHKT